MKPIHQAYKFPLNLGKAVLSAGVKLGLAYEISCFIGLLMSIFAACGGYILPAPADDIFIWMGVMSVLVSFGFFFFGLHKRYQALPQPVN